MKYTFFDRGDDGLLAVCELPCDEGIAIAIRTTGYELGSDEVIEIAIVDLDGKELFAKRVKPQNVEQWSPAEATGGLAPEDVSDLPELYQFEDEISELFEKAPIAVFQHQPFAQSAIEASWVSLPSFLGADVVELFRQSHGVAPHPNEPAPAASLAEVATYYGLPTPGENLAEQAACIARCYRAIVDEHVRERDAKGEDYWRRYEEERAGERAVLEQSQAVARMREHRLNQMNGLLWVCGAIIFCSLAIQLYQRGGDMSLIVICGVMVVFTLFRAVTNFRK